MSKKIELFNKVRKSFHDELLLTCHEEKFDDYTDFSKEQIREFYEEAKKHEEEFLKMHFLTSDKFKNTCFNLSNPGALVDSFSYTSHLYLISTGIFQKGSINPLSKKIKKSKEDKEREMREAPEKLEKLSKEIKDVITSQPTPVDNGLNDIINEVLSSVKEETGGQDLSGLDLSPADILGSVTSKNSNDKLKNKTGVDFGSLISTISSKIEKRVESGEIDISNLQKMFQ